MSVLAPDDRTKHCNRHADCAEADRAAMQAAGVAAIHCDEPHCDCGNMEVGMYRLRAAKGSPAKQSYSLYSVEIEDGFEVEHFIGHIFRREDIGRYFSKRAGVANSQDRRHFGPFSRPTAAAHALLDGREELTDWREWHTGRVRYVIGDEGGMRHVLWAEAGHASIFARPGDGDPIVKCLAVCQKDAETQADNHPETTNRFRLRAVKK